MTDQMIEYVAEAIRVAEEAWWNAKEDPAEPLCEVLAVAAIKAMDQWRFEAAGIT